MDTYAPASTLGWLDFDAAASERMGALLRSLDEPSTLDVLGLGTVRDALSDMLSPGTSTLHTRLRYFIFLAWIFQRLEKRPLAPADFARRLRDAEARLIDCLRHLGPDQGVIGRVAGRELKQMPSGAYWAGMAAWGIRRLDMSLAQYGQRAAALGRRRPEHDDDGNSITPSAQMWAPIPAPPEHFLSADLDFDLEPEEAQILIDGLRHRHPNTLVPVLSTVPVLSLDADFAWHLPVQALPDHLARLLHHARCFSELTLGPRLVYNLLLAEDAARELGWDTAELIDDQRGRLADWTRLVESRSEELSAWASGSEEFWPLLAGYGISGATQHFWDEMFQRAVQDPGRFADDPGARSGIRRRELRLKSKRARLSHRAALENWNQMPFGGQLDYRWPITKSYLQDLAAAGVKG